ncbi:MAG: M3 family oligoendopeptidase [Leptolyngbya sp. SIO4C1]|nr:M3 family oligoendopeptidase [Leptolyngbya sp. SIO4C1]
MPSLQQTWDNRQFFSSTADPQIAAELSALQAEVEPLAAACAPFAERAEAAVLSASDYAPLMAAICQIYQRYDPLQVRLSNLRTFIYTALSVDAKDRPASQLMPRLQQLSAELEQAMKPLDVFLLRVDRAFITALVADPALASLSFSLHHRRQLSDQLLSVAAESLVAGLSVSGLYSWGNLYDELAGTLKCDVQGETMGLAQASNLLGHPQRDRRAAAWQGIRNAWVVRQETVAAILNAINGWRLEETKQRSHRRSLHYLDKSCHQNGIERATLNALMETTYARRSVGQRALKAMAQMLDIPQLAPWDLKAPAPASGETTQISWERALELIATAFRQLTPAMGDFAIMMAEKGWIDARPTPNRAVGAYCTKFADPRQPRIFITFEGTLANVMTLAHELGHAWHNWVMRDLPLRQTRYPMTLAETASIFAETLVRDALLKQAKTPAQQREILWQEAQSAAVFLLNIPARFEFEQRLVESRQQGFAIASQLRTLMRQSWQLWYEDSLCDYDDMFWASKLHFSIAQLGFYNYPYLFGYLFSLGIYAQQSRYGEHFNNLYTAMLRDTGAMTAEALVRTHLQQEIAQPQFWQASLDLVERTVSRFEQLVSA